MNKEQILAAIKELSQSQGSYGRLYRELTSGSSAAEQALSLMVKQNFKDVVEMVLWLEC